MTDGGTSTDGRARSICGICGKNRADIRAVIESPPGVHHAENTLICDECEDHERVLHTDRARCTEGEEVGGESQ